jgi:hypothetical protein
LEELSLGRMKKGQAKIFGKETHMINDIEKTTIVSLHLEQKLGSKTAIFWLISVLGEFGSLC